MKKLTTVFAAIAFFLSATAFANIGVNETVQTAFEKKFSKAKKVAWSQTDGYYFASFELDKKEIAVAYNEDGQLLAVSRAITTAQLSPELINAIKDQFADYTLCAAVTEIVLEGEKTYYLNVENKKKVLRLKCSADGHHIAVAKQTRKTERKVTVY